MPGPQLRLPQISPEPIGFDPSNQISPISVSLPTPILSQFPPISLPAVPRLPPAGAPSYKHPPIDFLKTISFTSPTLKSLNKLTRQKDNLPSFMSVELPKPSTMSKPSPPNPSYIKAPSFSPIAVSVTYTQPANISVTIPPASVPSVPITFPTLTVNTSSIPISLPQVPDLSQLQSLFFLDVVIPSLPFIETSLSFTNRSLPVRMAQEDRCISYRNAEYGFIPTVGSGIRERVELDTIIMNIKLKTAKYQTQVDAEQKYYRIILTYYEKFISNLVSHYNAQAKSYEAQMRAIFDHATLLQAVVRRNRAVANYFRQSVQMNKVIISANSNKLQSLESLNQLNRAAVSVYEKYMSVANKIREINSHNLSILQNYIQGYDAAMSAYVSSVMSQREALSFGVLGETLKLAPVYLDSLESTFQSLEAALNKEYEEYNAEVLKLQEIIPILKERITLELQSHSLIEEKTLIKLDSAATEANARKSEIESDLETRQLQAWVGLARELNQLEKSLRVANGDIANAIYDLRRVYGQEKSERRLATGRVDRARKAAETKVQMSVIETLM